MSSWGGVGISPTLLLDLPLIFILIFSGVHSFVKLLVSYGTPTTQAWGGVLPIKA